MVPFYEQLKLELAKLQEEGLFKQERPFGSPQQAEIVLEDGRRLLNLCANNYLGLANHPRLIAAAKEGVDRYGFGTASVRFICGTQTIHRELERTIADFLGMEDAIVYPSCFDANGGLFEALLSDADAIISDQLNHASIIDGIRLCKAERFRYRNNDMGELKLRLIEAQKARYRLIATDGVFSMDGIVADLPNIVRLAKEHDALVMVDDCHATGILGERGHGTPEACAVEGKVDILTSTLGKALGGATGGFTAGKREVVGWLRQRSRPNLFSNALAPSLVYSYIEAFKILKEEGARLRARLHANSRFFRKEMEALGFKLGGANHPIIPVMIGDAKIASQFAAKMVERGIFVVSFSYPVVPQQMARIRTQMSAAHTEEQLKRAVEAFHATALELGVLESRSLV